ncbi:MAG TPA: carbohydrate ABC transporter permease, partial [Anaerolineae bacterium]|nr:carbohydrate ABC transporter permease [Anaerolineae bacterium]
RDFLFALSLTSTPRGMTIPVGISSFVQEYSIRYGEMAAGAFFAMIPALLMVAFAQRYIIKGLTLGALKG